jgi:hypothetical protein
MNTLNTFYCFQKHFCVFEIYTLCIQMIMAKAVMEMAASVMAAREIFLWGHVQ